MQELLAEKMLRAILLIHSVLLGSKCERAYCPSLWQASCHLPASSSMENCNSKIGHFIMKKHFPSNIPLRPFILRASSELVKYCSAISQYQLHMFL